MSQSQRDASSSNLSATPARGTAVGARQPGPRPLRQHASVAALLALLLGLGALGSACSSIYYDTLEKFGIEKRDVLADRVEEGRDAQQEAGEQFKTTLEAFKSATGFQGGKLEDTYNKLNDEYERCESSAEEVSDRIESIESVATDLFAEWKTEINEISSPELRSNSQNLLTQTKDRYQDLIGAMKKAESRMPPVLTAFKDQVLFLKHNLNAQAIASLQSNVAGIEKDVAKLVSDMEASIAEADAFIKTLG